MGTDQDWDNWGESDPYFGVLSSEEYRTDNMDDAARTKFFRSGDEYIGRVLANIRRHIDAGYQPRSCLDFGCGVGRLVIPLAGVSESVTGIDVSDHMLAEAASNCRGRQIENVSFVKSDDGLSLLTGSFNLIHSCLVLQHIPTRKGMRLLDALIRHLEPGGMIVIQFYFRCDARKLIRALVKLRYRLPIANAARNLIRGRPLREPAMQLHTYDLETIVSRLIAAGVDKFFLAPSKIAEFQSIVLYARKTLPSEGSTLPS